MIKIRTAFVYVLIFFMNILASKAYAQDTILKDGIVAFINGETISMEEITREINSCRATIYSAFIEKYKIQDGNLNWLETYGSEVPWEVVKEKALEQAIRKKVQLLLMQEKGVLKETSYSAFIKELEDVNQKRKHAVANHEVVYGPVEYSEKTYFNYLFTNNLILLKKSLQQKEILLNDSILKVYYERKKENYKNSVGEYLLFEEVKNSLSRNYVDAKYEELIDHLMVNAKIEINRMIYDQIIP